MKYILLFVLSWASIAIADTSSWQGTVTVAEKSYPAKLTFMCTQDKKGIGSGVLSLILTLSDDVAQYIPINDLEGPGAKLSMPAKISARGQNKKPFQMTAKTSISYSGEEAHKINFDIVELHRDHKQLYQLFHYLSSYATSFDVVLINPQKNGLNLMVKTDNYNGSMAMKQLLKNCKL